MADDVDQALTAVGPRLREPRRRREATLAELEPLAVGWAGSGGSWADRAQSG